MKKRLVRGSRFPALVNLPRRGFLAGGLSALGLAALQHRATAQAGGLAPPRFVFIYTPCGREPSWRTDTPGSNFTLAPTLQMFEPYRSRMALLDGFTIVNFDYGVFNSHLAGVCTMLCGRVPIKKVGNFQGGIPASSQRTFDHLLADRIGTTSPVRNIVLGGLDSNNDAGNQQISYTGSDQPELPIHEPDRAFAALFAGASSTPMAGDAVTRQAWEKEVLGLSLGQTAAVKRLLGQRELQQLQAYEANLNDAFQHASAPVMPVANGCTHVDFQQLQAGLAAPEYQGLSTQQYQVTHDLQSRTLAAALACGRTRVATYVMASHLGSMTVPGGRPADPKLVGTPFAGAHHLHDDGAFDHYRAFDKYYGARIKFLLDELDKYPEGSGTVLDNTVVMWSTEIDWTPNEHDHERHFILLFGGIPGKKLKMGQYLKIPYNMGASRDEGLANPQNRRMHEVLLTIGQAMGITDLQDFADPKYNQGPVTELLA
jgi:hypothetical protein